MLILYFVFEEEANGTFLLYALIFNNIYLFSFFFLFKKKNEENLEIKIKNIFSDMK
jgi:hypothetical protein